MPAWLIWQGFVSGDAADPANWSDGNSPSQVPDHAPGAGDVLEFSYLDRRWVNGYWAGEEWVEGGWVTGQPCADLSGAYDAIVVQNTCDWTIGMAGPVTVRQMFLGGGAIDQAGNDLTVSGGYDADPDAFNLTNGDSFYWCGGTLNSGSTLGDLNVLGGNVEIFPTAVALVTGSTLNFVGTNAAVIGTIYPGEIDFSNGAGIDIYQYCALNVAPVAAQPVKFDGSFQIVNGAPGVGSVVNVQAGGFFTVVGGGDVSNRSVFNGFGMPLANAGTTTISNAVDATFTVTKAGVASYSQTAGVSQIENGCVMQLVNTGVGGTGGILITGGIFQTLHRSDLADADQRVDIVGSMTVRGDSGTGVILGVQSPFMNPRFAGSVLRVTGDVVWSGGYYSPNIDSNGNADLWTALGNFRVAGNDVISPQLQGQPNEGQMWAVITAFSIMGNLPGTLEPNFSVSADQLLPPKRLFVQWK